jgi:hypothetical protein
MACRTVLLGWILVHSSLFAAAPDLLVWGPSANPYVDYMTFASDSCEVREGCVVAGRRRVLRFETESRNVGTADLVFGDPAHNPMFVWDPCHGHYHFGQFTTYRLLNQSGGVVLEGRKIGFCLEDTVKWDPNAGARRYGCSYQGIQRGWADRYTYNVPCQFLDITGVPAGSYILDMTVDPLNLIPELNEGNNNTQVSVQIPPGDCSTPPPNDFFANAQTISFVPQVIYGQSACASKEAGERNHAGDPGGHSVWYRWTAPFSRQIGISTEGSSFDTLLAVYRYAGGNLTLVVENDDVLHTVIRHSEVRFNTQAGTEYRIAIDGWNGEAGNIVMSMDTPANDDFAACQTLSGMNGSIAGHNVGATRESGEPTHGATYGTRSVWYCWTAPRAGTVEWSTVGSNFDTTLAIYRGTAVNQLTAVASDNDSGAGGTSIVRFPAASNTVYRVAIDSRGDGMGNIALGWIYLSGRLTIRRNANGSLTLTITGSNGTYTLQSSSDLKTWGSAGTVTVVNGTGTTTQANNTSRRFYRAVLPTQ